MDNNQWFVQSAVKLRRKYGIQFDRDWGDLGISAAEGLMLKVISCNEGITVSALGNKMGYNKSLVTKNMKMLTKHEFVRTERVDGRTMAIYTSQKGKEFIDKTTVKSHEFVDAIFVNCTPDERIEFFKILGKLKLD